MRKTRLKADYPDRRYLLKESRDGLKNHRQFVHKNGSVTNLNFNKRLLFGIPYKDDDFQKDFLRYTNSVFNRVASRIEKEGLNV